MRVNEFRMSHLGRVFYESLTGHKWIVVILFSFFALCILAVSLTFFALSLGKPYIGITLSMNNEGWAVSSVDTIGLANQDGINEGDRPIEINGQPAQVFLERYKNTSVVFSTIIKELTVVDDIGQLKSVTLQGGSSTWQSVAAQTARFAVTLVFWITGFYVLLKKPRNVVAQLLCLSGILFGLIMSSNMAGEIEVPATFQLNIIATIISPWLLLHLFLVFPEERVWLHNKPLLYLIYLPAVVTLILFFMVGHVDDQPVQWFRNVRVIEIGAVFLAVIGVAIFNYFGSVSVKTRKQMEIVSVSCLAAIIPFFVLYLLPETISGRSILPPELSILFIGFIPIGIGYAVVTKRLMDIDIVIRRGMIYGLITLVMAAIMSVVIFLVTTFHASIGTSTQILAALVVGGLAAIFFGPLKKRIEILIDKVFYKDRYDYRQVIQSLSNALNSVKSLPDISRLIVGTTVNTLNLMGGCLFIKTQSDSFDVVVAQGVFIDVTKQQNLRLLMSQPNSRIEFPNLVISTERDIAFIIRLKTGEQEIGVLCLAHKVTGQHFSSDDLYLIQGISSVSSIALHSAILIRDFSMRDTFVSIASHELRTPLTAITGYSDLLLRRDPPDATRKKWLKTIFDNSQRIMAMANDLLNVSRIQSSKITLELERLRLTEILNEQIEMAKDFTDKHEFVTNIESNLPDVLVDRDKFGQVVANLLNNAVKYSPNGGRITLSAHHDQAQNYVILSFTDEGIGISDKDISSLFTTFHRIQRPETHSVRGSGLGLFIAKEWTEAMGGKIWVESELNKGSTFFVTIPT